ncbi:MAG: SPOR domain-containing protein [Gammaproteobacteria bacterium]|nr:SPOR domain-containing protein [Gammaproteobacteria bacterium]
MPTPNITHRLSMFRDNMADIAFFLDGERDAISKKMAHLIDFTKLILFVQGINGVGKTSLLKYRFLHNKKSTWRVCVIDAAVIKNTNDLLSKLSVDLGFSQPSRQAPAIELIVQQLEDLRKSGQIGLLVIDNAEELDKNQCALISDLGIRHQGLPALIRLVMFGEHLPKPLDQAIKHAAQENKEEQINNIVLPRLGEKETSDYIRHCLQHMDNTDSHLFDPATVRSIFEKSGGLIPRINDLANRVLGAPAKSSATSAKKQGKKELGLMPIIASALAVTFVVSLFLFDQSPSTPEQIDNVATETEIDPDRVTTELALPAQGGDAAAQRHTISIKDGEVKNSFDQASADDAPQPISPLMPSAVEFTDGDVAANASQPDVAAAPPTVPAAAPARVEPPAPAKPEPQTNTPMVASIPEKKPEPKPEPAAKKPEPKSEPAQNGPLTAEKFRKAPRGYFTVQLSAGSNEAAIKQFISEHKLDKQSIYLTGTRDGKPWFTVVHGVFKDRASAEQASKKLPSSIKSKPWVRTVEGLQK